LNSARAWAFTLLGIDQYSRRLGGDRLANQTRDTLVQRLMDGFEQAGGENWPWCEDAVTYDNPRLAQALILSGVAMDQKNVLDTGLKALRWLVDLQTSPEGYFRPIGCSGFYKRGEARADFDQQPIEANAMVSACLDAYRVTSAPYWYEHAARAFDWFLGWNDLGLELYSPGSGGCYDALHVDRVNQNQGAESLLSFLLSLAEMNLAEADVTTFIQSAPSPEMPAAAAEPPPEPVTASR